MWSQMMSKRISAVLGNTVLPLVVDEHHGTVLPGWPPLPI